MSEPVRHPRLAILIIGLAAGVGLACWLLLAPPARAQDPAPPAKAGDAEWEFIGDEKEMSLLATNRLRVPGGWLVSSENLTFIPDPDHAWAETKKVEWKKDVPRPKMPGWGEVAVIHRAEVPGGWLLSIFVPGDAHVLFYPDPEHAWKP